MTPEINLGDEIPPGSGVIEPHLAELAQLFNSIDPSPFYEKDLDREAVTPEVAEVLRRAIQTFFRNRAEQSRKRVRQLFRVGQTSLLIGLVFLAACLAAGEQLIRALPKSPFAAVLRESFLIGGWVAMWRPLEIFLYDWWPIRNEGRLYERLSRTPVRIACSGRQAPAREPAPF